MDRDPFIQCDLDNRSASVIQIESLGKGGVAAVICACILMVLMASCSVYLSLLALDRIDQSEKRQGDRVKTAEARAMDFAYLAKQEARIALDKIQELEKRRQVCQSR
jgi:hypothetical protein